MIPFQFYVFRRFRLNSCACIFGGEPHGWGLLPCIAIAQQPVVHSSVSVGLVLPGQPPPGSDGLVPHLWPCGGSAGVGIPEVGAAL